jgi:hypothetical protein
MIGFLMEAYRTVFGPRPVGHRVAFHKIPGRYNCDAFRRGSDFQGELHIERYRGAHINVLLTTLKSRPPGH